MEGHNQAAKRAKNREAAQRSRDKRKHQRLKLLSASGELQTQQQVLLAEHQTLWAMVASEPDPGPATPVPGSTLDHMNRLHEENQTLRYQLYQELQLRGFDPRYSPPHTQDGELEMVQASPDSQESRSRSGNPFLVGELTLYAAAAGADLPYQRSGQPLWQPDLRAAYPPPDGAAHQNPELHVQRSLRPDAYVRSSHTHPGPSRHFSF